MSLLRQFCLVLLLVAWLPATGHCVWQGVVLPEVEDCCGEHEEGDAPAGNNCATSCARCVTLGSGVHQVSSDPVLITVPAVQDDPFVARMLAALARAVREPDRQWEEEVPEPGLALCQFLARTASPVRGPSLLA